mmetsp:Transcript_11639/g.23656  ORF Transcript_11639/g.23656 Transcript_11639/m.23656 type:complete len:84 (-) Transcript_11639:123-374(-)
MNRKAKSVPSTLRSNGTRPTEFLPLSDTVVLVVVEQSNLHGNQVEGMALKADRRSSYWSQVDKRGVVRDFDTLDLRIVDTVLF